MKFNKLFENMMEDNTEMNTRYEAAYQFPEGITDEKGGGAIPLNVDEIEEATEGMEVFRNDQFITIWVSDLSESSSSVIAIK